MPQPQKNTNKLISSFILIIVVAIIAGFTGGVLSSSYLPDVDNFFSRETFIEKPQKDKGKNVNLSYEQNLDLPQAIIGIYPLKTVKSEALSLEGLYNYSEAIAQGLILTSDGWVVTSFDEFIAGKKYVAITEEGRIFPITSFISDSFTGVNFFKLDQDVNGVAVNNFNVFKLFQNGYSNQHQVGDEVYLLNRLGQAVFKRIKDLSWDQARFDTKIVKSTEVNSKFILLAGELGSDFYSAPVINGEGEMLGIMKHDKELEKDLVIPMSNLEKAVSSLLRNGKITRSFFGVDYLDLFYNYNLNLDIGRTQNKGALIWTNSGAPFKPASPAEIAGLQVNDIIISVENEEVNGSLDLTTLIQYYDPGDKIKLNVLRHGAAKEVIVELTAGK